MPVEKFDMVCLGGGVAAGETLLNWRQREFD